MPRDLTATVETESESGNYSPVFFCHLDVDGDPLWAWTGQGTKTVTVASDPLLSAGQAFIGTGAVGQVSDIVQAADGSVAEVTLTLLYVDFTDEAASDLVNAPSQWSMRAGVLWLGFIDSSGAVLADPVRLLTGRIVHVAARDGASPTIVVKLAAKSTMDGQRSANWMLNDAHQQTFYSGDKALEFVPQLQGAAINFGVPDQTARTSGPGNRVRSDRQYEQLR